MSDPPRLLDEGANDFEQDLLRSWHDERPSPSARGRVLAAVTAGVAVGTTTTIAKGAATGGGAAASVAPKALAGVALAKWLGIGALVLAGAGATAVYIRPRSPAPTTGAIVAPNAPVAASSPIAAPVPSVGPGPHAAESSAPVASNVRATIAPSSTRADLASQVALLDSARKALSSGDTAGTIRDVNTYEARFPHGALGEEAEVLRVEALAASGERATAARAAKHFVAAYPHSPHAPRMRALLDATETR